MPVERPRGLVPKLFAATNDISQIDVALAVNCPITGVCRVHNKLLIDGLDSKSFAVCVRDVFIYEWHDVFAPRSNDRIGLSVSGDIVQDKHGPHNCRFLEQVLEDAPGMINCDEVVERSAVYLGVSNTSDQHAMPKHFSRRSACELDKTLVRLNIDRFSKQASAGRMIPGKHRQYLGIEVDDALEMAEQTEV